MLLVVRKNHSWLSFIDQMDSYQLTLFLKKTQAGAHGIFTTTTDFASRYTMMSLFQRGNISSFYFHIFRAFCSWSILSFFLCKWVKLPLLPCASLTRRVKKVTSIPFVTFADSASSSSILSRKTWRCWFGSSFCFIVSIFFIFFRFRTPKGNWDLTSKSFSLFLWPRWSSVF
jgi:hypothetical protein